MAEMTTSPDGSSRPVPDPTQRTLETAARELKSLREILEARLDGMDAAIGVASKTAADVHTSMRGELNALEKLQNEKFVSAANVTNTKFDGVQTQFTAAATGVTTALQAQEKQATATNETNNKATTKMEDNFTKLLDEQKTSRETLERNVTERINDLKGRMDRGEGKTSVADPATATALSQMSAMLASLAASRDTSAGKGAGATQLWGFIVGGIGMLVSVISVAIAVITFIVHSGNAPDSQLPTRLVEQNSASIGRLENELASRRAEAARNYTMPPLGTATPNTGR